MALLQRLTRILTAGSATQSLFADIRSHARLLALVRDGLPSPLNRHCMAAIARRSELVIYADSAVWVSRLRFAAPQLLTFLRSHGAPAENIRVRILQQTIIHKKPKQISRRAISPRNAQILRDLAADVEDPTLRSSLIRLSRHTAI
jgi:hypothetical protein